MTIEKIKEELPDTHVIVNGKKYLGRLSGRKCAFASV